jgi:hypothetical protein
VTTGSPDAAKRNPGFVCDSDSGVAEVTRNFRVLTIPGFRVASSGLRTLYALKSWKVHIRNIEYRHDCEESFGIKKDPYEREDCRNIPGWQNWPLYNDGIGSFNRAKLEVEKPAAASSPDGVVQRTPHLASA